MSEIEDGAFAIMETGRLMSQTLPRYKFYADIASQTFTKTAPSADEIQINLVRFLILQDRNYTKNIWCSSR